MCVFALCAVTLQAAPGGPESPGCNPCPWPVHLRLQDMWAAANPKRGCESPQPREPADFPSKPTPAAAHPWPLTSPKQDISVICSMLPVQCLYFYSQVCGLSLCGCRRGVGYFLLLCIFLLNCEGFHFLPKLSVLP